MKTKSWGLHSSRVVQSAELLEKNEGKPEDIKVTPGQGNRLFNQLHAVNITANQTDHV